MQDHAPDTLHLLLLDDHPLFRDGVVFAFAARAADIRVTLAAVPDEADALIDADPEAIDLVIVDHGLPGARSGLDWAQALRARHPSLPCALISGDEFSALASRARQAGLAGFLPKSLRVEELLAAVREIVAGNLYFVDATTGPGELTPRQRDIIDLAARGASSKEIARTLAISPATVRNHFAQIFERLGARNRTQAVELARR